MEDGQSASDFLELNSKINFLNNELLIRNEEIGFLKAALKQVETEKQSLTKNFQDSKHEGEYLTSRYKAQSKVFRKDYEELEKKLQRKSTEVRNHKRLMEQKEAQLRQIQAKYKNLEVQMHNRSEESKLATAEYKSKVGDLQRSIKKLKQDIKGVQELKTTASEESKQWKLEHQLLKAQLKEIHKLNESLTKKLDNQVKKNKELREKLSEKSKDMEEMSNQCRLLSEQINDSEEKSNRNHIKLMDSQAVLQSNSLASLRKQHDKIVSYYVEQINSLKEQLAKQSVAELAVPRLGNTQHELKTLIDILNNCLTYELPYLALVDADKEFRQHPQLLKIFESIKSKLQHIHNLKDQNEHLAKEAAEYEDKLNVMGLELIDLNQKLRVSERQHHTSYQAVKQELALYIKERDKQLQKLQQQIHQKDRENVYLQEKYGQLEERFQAQSRLQQNRLTKKDPDNLLDVNDQNAQLRMKCFYLINIIEIMVGIIASQQIQLDRVQSKLTYYRTYEAFYWDLWFNTQKNDRITFSENDIQPHISASRKRLKKIAIVILFWKVCERKVKHVSKTSPHLIFSYLNKQVSDKRLSNILSKQSKFNERLVVNSFLEQLKKDNCSNRSQFDWAVELISQEKINALAIIMQSQREGDDRCYPSRLFAREMLCNRLKIEAVYQTLAPFAQQSMQLCKPLQVDSMMARSRATSPYHEQSRYGTGYSRKNSQQGSHIGELKRELDQAMYLGVKSEVRGQLSPRMCGSIRSLRTRQY